VASELVLSPASIPQEMFINSEADICFYGGQAGGGKTFSALMHHLKFADDPYYRGLILRRTTPMLMKPGAIWDEAKDIYRSVDPECQIKIKDLKVVFSSGAEVAFSHFEHVEDKDNFQGSQISSVFFDELCQFEEEQFLYLLSRLRTKAKMKPCARAAMNPDPDSFVRKWVDWYLYPQGHEFFGRPDTAKQGKVRWFVRSDDTMIWGDTKEELLRQFPKSTPLSFQYISASVYDNPYIQPSYIAFLEGLGRVEKERLLYGSWEARPEGSGFFKREWVAEIPHIPDTTEFVKIVRAWDLAGSLKSDQNPDPDYSAGVKMGKTKSGRYVILDTVRFRARAGEVLQKILAIAADDGTGVDISIPSDPNSAAKAAATMMVSEIASNGFYARARPSNKSKVDRFRPFASVAEHGLVDIVKGCTDDLENKTFSDNNPYYGELEKFDGGRKGHDDWCDATSDAFMALATGLSIPNFSLPDMKQSNPFNTP